MDVDTVIKNIAYVYTLTKELVLNLEEMDETQKANPQFYIGMRNAYDHFMRVVAVQHGIIKVDDEKKYVEKNLDACFNHIYRIGFDCLDMSAIVLRKKIADELSGFSNDAINNIIPEYYKEIKPYIVDLMEKIAGWRKSKDVGNILNVHVFVEYRDAIFKLSEYYKNIIRTKPSLIEYDKKHIKDKNKEYIFIVIVTIAAAIIGAIIHTIYTIFF